MATVHLEIVHLDGDDTSASLAVLSQDERDRAARFRFDLHRRRFVAARAALRRRLAAELGARAQEIEFGYGPYGKPFLARASDVRFNLSHSSGCAVMALVRGAEVGVDIEHIRPIDDVERLAGTVFSDSERNEWDALPATDRLTGFFAGWTRKESYVKALGDGLQRPLGAFDVPIAPGTEPRLLAVRGAPDEPQRWWFSTLDGIAGYAGTVCVEGSGHRIAGA